MNKTSKTWYAVSSIGEKYPEGFPIPVSWNGNSFSGRYVSPDNEAWYQEISGTFSPDMSTILTLNFSQNDLGTLRITASDLSVTENAAGAFVFPKQTGLSNVMNYIDSISYSPGFMGDGNTYTQIWNADKDDPECVPIFGIKISQ
jgi:hypothetical protein